MNNHKAAATTTLMVVLLASGCTSMVGANTSPIRLVASSPTAQQTRDNMREWLRAGGSDKQTAIAGDLLSLSDGKWRSNPFLTKVVADALTKDVAAAMNFRAVPDQKASNVWANYLTDLKIMAFTLEGVGGGYTKAGDSSKIQKAGVLLVDVNREQQQFRSRLAQINAVRGTH